MTQEENKVIWSWKSNKNPWSLKEPDEWTPFSSINNSQIEQAFLAKRNEIIIDRNYKIDFTAFIQTNIIDPDKQRPIRRCSNDKCIISHYRRERFNFVQPIEYSITNDTPYHGSTFITDWLVMFTKATLKIKLSQLIDALINGILIEGEIAGSLDQAQHLTKEIRTIKKKTIESLQQCCARLYTKPCFLFKVVNETLRDNDHTKLTTLGPFCYLLFNYIGEQHDDYLSIRKQVKQFIKSKKHYQFITVYRGEELALNEIDKYQQAVGKDFSYKWSSFISTSKSRQVAEMYASNVLYVIEIQRKLSSDQYVDLSPFSYVTEEEEILLRPGVRLKIVKYEFDSRTKRYIFYVQILPSFISNIT
ncbi:unnamed protein product [Rotaria sp. Silwood2]|nr:unnamed protein product [Rotaria sp. Silwood2]CAF2683850.1 unnamed protein product [Rotaria sp. Silwood2]CAF2956759.1 unnamed protein product [Rotaria sp. Silwood2]CAF3092267.1 unnamed protein product [Rotaria sp. Silwood2]CAF4385400.1 unnamed protein product [Rotaria sp. Silwood2]